MHATFKNKRNYILLVLALCIHLILLAFLFLPQFEPLMFSFPKSRYEHEFPTLDSELKKDWAARQTPAPTIFMDDHEQQAEDVPDDANQTPAVQPVDEPTVDDLPIHEKEILVEQPTTPVDDSATTTQKAIVEPKESPAAQAPSRTQVAQPSRKPRKRQLKKKINLADITDSFMQRMHNIPVGQLFMQGNVANMPPDKQIIFERYRTKLGAIVAQVVSEHPYPLQSIPQAQLHMYLEMDRSGRFTDLHLVQSCGVQAADDYALFIYSQASKRFPPIPESLDSALFKGILRLSYYTPKPGERQNKNLFIFD